MIMAKTRKDPSGTRAATRAAPASLDVRSTKTGQVVTVRGVGALKGRDLEFQRHVSLLRPIAEQALVSRSDEDRSE